MFLQKLLVGVQLSVAAQDQCAAIGGREVDVEHLDGGELVEHGPRSEARCQRLELGAQGDVKAIGQEGDEDVRFDAVLKLVIDRAELQIVGKPSGVTISAITTWTQSERLSRL